MQVIGIVAEYNPFHTGHRFQIEESRNALGGEDTAVVAVMSGNWVQQADCAIADKWLRTRMALAGGADLVLELPTVWATSSAEGFASGAVTLLDACGIVDRLSFGSECGSVNELERVAACIDSSAYQDGLRRMVDEGTSFASCRQAVVGSLLGDGPAALLSKPNNNLGVEYIRALRTLHSTIRPFTVRRKGAPHNGVVFSHGDTSPHATCASMTVPQFVSATQIRLDLMEGRWDQAEPYLVPGGRELLAAHIPGLPGLARVERAILAKVRTMTAADWALLPDSGAAEGLPQRLERAGRQSASMEQFFDLAKTKRYTHARLRRLVLRAYLGITAADLPSAPPYLRVLGFNTQGRELLRAMKKRARLPILTKAAHAQTLDQAGQQLFTLEARCTDLYDLCLEVVPSPGREWSTGPVIVE